jgi:hypothetical protein
MNPESKLGFSSLPNLHARFELVTSGALSASSDPLPAHGICPRALHRESARQQ